MRNSVLVQDVPEGVKNFNIFLTIQIIYKFTQIKSIFVFQMPNVTWWPDILPKDTLPKDTLPKDILPSGHFAERHFVERTFCRTDSLTNRPFRRRKDILPKRQLVENREILGVVARTDYDWLLNKSSQSYNQFINLMTETLIVK